MRIPVAREGYPFILAAFVLVIISFFTGIWWLEVFFIILGIFVLQFFRDPERNIPADKKAIVSPADGRVIKVDRLRKDERFLGTEAIKISIFMNVFNVHVNRTPATGKVLKVIYNPGKFFNASLDKASLENEQNALVMETPSGRKFAFNQIAGLIARRIVCYAKPGDRLEKGVRFGMIRFGSRVDVFLPVDCKIAVQVGDKTKAGSTILGYWHA